MKFSDLRKKNPAKQNINRNQNEIKYFFAHFSLYIFFFFFARIKIICIYTDTMRLEEEKFSWYMLTSIGYIFAATLIQSIPSLAHSYFSCSYQFRDASRTAPHHTESWRCLVGPIARHKLYVSSMNFDKVFFVLEMNFIRLDETEQL